MFFFTCNTIAILIASPSGRFSASCAVSAANMQFPAIPHSAGSLSLSKVFLTN